jgi:hypothetical protein
MIMPDRNPLSLWIVIGIFLTAMVAVPLTCWMQTPPATPPPILTELSTLTELAEVLSQQAPEWHRVPIMKNGSLELGFYLCSETRSWEQLTSVRRSYRDAARWRGVVHCAARWRGVVHCEYISNIMPVAEWNIQEWGEHAMRIGPFLFFGDPDMLRRIDKIIRSIPAR